MTGEGGDAVLIKYQKLHVRNRQFTIIRSMPWKEENEKSIREELGTQGHHPRSN